MPFPAHCVSVVLLPWQSKGAVLQGWPHPLQHLAMLQWHARCLFLKEIQLFVEEETKEETEIIYFVASMFVKKSLQIRFDQLMQYFISPRLHRDLSKRERASRCLIRPWLGTSPRPRSKQSLAHDCSSPSRTFRDWFPSGSSQYFSHMSFTWEVRWVKAVPSQSFPQSHFLMALSWSTSDNKPCRKPGW